MKNDPPKILVHLALFLVGWVYAANNLIAKVVMPEYVEAFGFVLIRVAGATLLFFFLHLIVLRKLPTVERTDFKELLVCALTGVVINMLLFFKGLELSVPIHAGVIMVITPVFVSLITAIALKKNPNKLVWIGTFVGVSGAILLTLYGKSLDANRSLGDVFILINAISYAYYLVRVKPLMKKYHPFTVVFWIMLIGLIFLIPFGIFQVDAIKWSLMSVEAVWSMVYVIVFTTFIAYLLNTWALAYTTSAMVGAYIYLQPVFTALLSIGLGRDKLSGTLVFFSIMIFYGVWLVNRGSTQKSN